MVPFGAGDRLNILAIEASTTECSAAAIRDASVLAEVRWEDAVADHQGFFRTLEMLLASAGVALRDIDCFAVDTGPGRFTGLRTSLAAARGMALPGGRPVVGIDSGAAMAWQAMRGGAPGPVVVTGDARRDRIWFARFGDGKTGPRQLTPYTCVPARDTASVLDRSDRVITSDLSSLGGTLAVAAEKSGAVLDAVRHVPAAQTVGMLASLHMAAGTSTAASIVYLHPPV